MSENVRKAELIKKALTIVDELAEIDMNDMGVSEEDMEHLDALADRAQKLKRDPLWKLR